MSDVGPAPVTVSTGDGFSVTSNEGTAAEVKANFESEEKDADAPPADEKKEAKKKVSEAASELGKKGGEASAKARAKAHLEDDEDVDEDEDTPAPKPKARPEPAKEPAQKPESDHVAKPAEEPAADDEPKRTKARMERLARERSEERQKRETVERELAEYKAKAARPSEGNRKPEITDFATAEEYADALAEHKVGERMQQQEREHRQRAQADWNAEKMQSFMEKTKGSPSHTQKLDPRLDVEPAFLLDPKDVTLKNVAAAELILSEHPLEVIDYLDEHDDELTEMLKGQNWPDIVRGFARINERIRLQKENGKAKPNGEAPKAPSYDPPARPARGVPASVQADGDEDVDSDDVSFERHFKVHNSRDQRLRRGR